MDDIFGSTLSGSATSTLQPAPSNPPQQPKTPFDEDDDFEGLVDAKEASDEEEFANISRNDFNPVFDSSPPPSQAKSESTAFGNESSFDFVSTSSANPTLAQAGTGQQKATDAHDWDAIFSGIDTSSTPTTAAPADKPPAQEEDDPILKRLTSMGYQRDLALEALEKYDYDVNKVCSTN